MGAIKLEIELLLDKVDPVEDTQSSSLLKIESLPPMDAL